MLRVYKLPNGRTYQFNEGEQPEGAILVELSAQKVMTPETPPESLPKPKTARKRTARKKEEKQ